MQASALELLTVTLFHVCAGKDTLTQPYYDRTLAEQILKEIKADCPDACLRRSEFNYNPSNTNDMAEYQAHLRAAAVETARKQA